MSWKPAAFDPCSMSAPWPRSQQPLLGFRTVNPALQSSAIQSLMPGWKIYTFSPCSLSLSPFSLSLSLYLRHFSLSLAFLVMIILKVCRDGFCVCFACLIRTKRLENWERRSEFFFKVPLTWVRTCRGTLSANSTVGTAFNTPASRLWYSIIATYWYWH